MVEWFKFDKNRNCCIWLERIPWIQQKTTMKHMIVELKKIIVLQTRREIALELYYPRNASYYGFFEAKFIPNCSEVLKIMVQVASDNKMKYSTQLIDDNQVYYGITEEYCDVVMQTCKTLIDDGIVNLSGVIEFKYGAYSEIGSSPMVFKVLTELIIGLITNEMTEYDYIEQYISSNM